MKGFWFFFSNYEQFTLNCKQLAYYKFTNVPFLDSQKNFDQNTIINGNLEKFANSFKFNIYYLKNMNYQYLHLNLAAIVITLQLIVWILLGNIPLNLIQLSFFSKYYLQFLVLAELDLLIRSWFTVNYYYLSHINCHFYSVRYL